MLELVIALQPLLYHIMQNTIWLWKKNTKIPVEHNARENVSVESVLENHVIIAFHEQYILYET